MKRVATGCLFGVFLVLFGACAPKNPGADAPEGETNLAEFELDKVPETVDKRLYADFGGKVQLLGYEMDPEDMAPPGSKVSMKLYWQRTGRLGPGWGLFTHLLDERGAQVAQRDGSGPLRKAGDGDVQVLGPSAWNLGKIYRDEIEFEIPRTVTRGDRNDALKAGQITVAVGVWKGARSDDPGGAARLDVIGHPADEYRRALVANLKTGVEPHRVIRTLEEVKRQFEGNEGNDKSDKKSDD